MKLAERRMFAKTIIDSDAFLDMPISSRLLYYDLGMRADDDGFVNSPKKIMKMIGASEDDMKVLVSKKFIIPFESGIVVIKHWKIHNYIQNDRYNETKYLEEKSTLSIDENKSYKKMDTECIQVVSTSDTQVRLGKVRLDKDSIYRQIQHLPYSIDDNKTLLSEGYKQHQIDEILDRMDNYAKLKTYKSAIATARNWLKKDYPVKEEYEDPNPFAYRGEK